MDVNEELKFFGRFTKIGGGGREGGQVGVQVGGGQGGCERRIEVFLKFKNKIEGGRGEGLGRGRGSGWGCQGGCKRRIEVFGKVHKKNRGGGWGVGRGDRVDVNGELKFLGKFKKQIVGGGGGGGSEVVGLVGSWWMWTKN